MVHNKQNSNFLLYSESNEKEGKVKKIIISIKNFSLETQDGI
jgi:hypothetical protein